MQRTRGCYFLADDKMFDYVVAFLNSYRKFNPDMPLCLIPFNQNIERISLLKENYHFEIFDDDKVLSYCDQLSHQFHDYTVGHYRKLACWFGHYDEFIYVDIDTVIQRDFSDLFEYLNSYNFVTATSNHLGIKHWVWKSSIDDPGSNHDLTRDQMDYAANTGFIISKKDSLSRELIDNALTKSKSIMHHMFLGCLEQPFLNYVIVTTTNKFSSLFHQRVLTNDPHIPLERYGGLGKNKVEAGVLIRMDDNQNIFPANPTLMVHFCGHNLNIHKGFDHKLHQLWLFYRDLNPAFRRTRLSRFVDKFKSIFFVRKITNLIRRLYFMLENKKNSHQ